MFARPPRTRNERQQGQNKYLSDQELKKELEKQAELKKQEKQLNAFQEKQQLLEHYQNYQMAQPNNDEELQQFLNQKRENISKEYNQLINELPLELQQDSQNRKAEDARIQRLRLREEERIRRQKGLETVYQTESEPLPFQIEKQIQQQGQQKHLFAPADNDPVQIDQNDYYQQDIQYPPQDRLPSQQYSQQDRQLISQQQQYSQYQERQVISQQQSYPQFNDYPQIERQLSNQQFEQYTQQDRQVPSQGSLKRSLTDQAPLESSNSQREKQRKYREELEKQINEKKRNEGNENRKPNQQQQEFFNKFGQSQRPQSGKSWQQKQAVADQVMQQVMNNNTNTSQQQFYQSSQRFRSQEQNNELDQKKKYKEELDRQIAEKKREQEKSRQMSRQSEVSSVIPTSPPQLQQQQYFQYPESPESNNQVMMETQQQQFVKAKITSNDVDQDKKRLQKQQYAEELRKQVEERNRKKKLEEQKEKENEEKLQRKMEKELEEEKQRLESKSKQKQQEIFEHQIANQQLAKIFSKKRIEEDNQTQKKQELFQNQDNQQNGEQDNQINLLYDPPNVQTQQLSQQQQQFDTQFQFQQQPKQVFQPQLQSNNIQQQQMYEQQSLQQQPSQQSFDPYLKSQPSQQSLIQQQPQSYMPQQQQFMHLHQQQFIPQSPPQQPVFQHFQDSIQQYQNILFNQNNNQPIQQNYQAQQIHQNYLLQLQQNRQEIEIVRQILEEKLRIQQIEMQNKMMIEQYRTKVQDIQKEQILFEKEIAKLQTYLTGRQQQKEPLNPQVFQTSLQISMLGQQQYLNQIQHIMPKHVQPLQESQVENELELPASSDYVPIENNSILVNNQKKSYIQDMQEYKQSQVLIDEVYQQQQNDSQQQDKLYTEQLNGYDVNLLRTQDYMNMFKQNIQTQSRQQDLKFPLPMLKQNSNSLESISQVESKPLFSQWSQTNNALRTKEFSQVNQQFVYPSNLTKPNVSNLDQIQEEDDQNPQKLTNTISQLAISASMPLSQIQQPKEIQMNDAEYQNNSLILPEDDLDEENFNNFIHSNQSQGENQVEQSEILKKPQTAGTESNYNSVSSKKFKKPKTINIFSKLDESQKKESSNKVILKEVQTQQNAMPPPAPQSQKQQSEIQSNYPVPSQIMSNYNPLTSQTTFIYQQENNKKHDQIMNRLDNFLSQMEQSSSKDSQLFQSKRINTSSQQEQRKIVSRKAKQISEARKEDLVYNQLDVLKESRESQQEFGIDFEYEESQQK